jgi:hypothetical protein
MDAEALHRQMAVRHVCCCDSSSLSLMAFFCKLKSCRQPKKAFSCRQTTTYAARTASPRKTLMRLSDCSKLKLRDSVLKRLRRRPWLRQGAEAAEPRRLALARFPPASDAFLKLKLYNPSVALFQLLKHFSRQPASLRYL